MVLFAVVGLLAPQAAHAGMGMMDDMSITDTMVAADTLHMNDLDPMSMDHGAGDPCAGLSCFYAMPFASGQSALLPNPVRVGNALANNMPLNSISPAMLRKPPKHA